METKQENREIQEAQRLIRRRGGVVRTSEALREGIASRILYAMRSRGLIESLGRGLFRLVELPPLSDPDIVTVSLRAPKAVICLVSALSFHGITTRIPHEVEIAIARGSETPRIEYPPVKSYWFSGEAFSAGVETHSVDKFPVRVYSVEKTLADCFKYRNKLGMETVLEAMKYYRERKPLNLVALQQYAGICRVARVMRPYMEAML